ncbi:MAG: hypothetical protein IH898_02370 [Planctomycetes bacterium]|nr:hypothetical protein [Planctomycetota bacterium]
MISITTSLRLSTQFSCDSNRILGARTNPGSESAARILLAPTSIRSCCFHQFAVDHQGANGADAETRGAAGDVDVVHYRSCSCVKHLRRMQRVLKGAPPNDALTK